jgi:pyruvate/2-oxoglutarate dehydrogenase complex dihydrolipoamide acyltransferase (E2) component
MELRVPRVGQSMTEAEVRAWLVEPGASVRAGDALLVIETDKAEFEIESPGDGVLGPHLARSGQVLPVGALLGHVLAPGERPAPAEARAERGRASPRARKLAAERGVDLTTLTGSGPGGLITADDVERAAASAPAVAASIWQGRAVRARRALSALERSSARRLAESWSRAPHFVQMVDADLTAAAALRTRWREAGGSLAAVTWNDLAVAALARALSLHPELNAAIDGDELVIFDAIDIGIAVDTPRGLVVPVLRGADRLSLGELARRARELIERTRRGGLAPDELQGGTATVSNLGAWGIRAGTPVLNPPESVLLFLGAVEPRPAVMDGALAIRTRCTLSLAFDHRATDGARAAALTNAVRSFLQDPGSLL